jgi:cytochrome c-type biogenesis protein CcmH/NrfG
MANLKEQLAKNPNDATNWYNLGVLQAKILQQQKQLHLSRKQLN